MESQLARFRVDLEALTGPAPARIGVAVSGGPDSLALLLLAHGVYPGAVHAATVDHGLRPEAAGEAAFVASICTGLGVPHATLEAGMSDTANLQAAARQRRYALLGAWARKTGLTCLATAHHLDDQAETLVMRLLRGAGLAGLAGIRDVHAGAVPVVRPLLGWRRGELADVVAVAGIEPVADPSNCDERFDRVRVRRRLARADWIAPEPLARSAAALAQAEGALQWAAERLWHERADGCTLDPAGVPDELRRRLLIRMLASLGGAAPRGEALARLLATLAKGGTATLAGVKCSGGALWRFTPAPPRRL
ncbi:MAG: tRNA(Ile)-lysidine synthase [Sphingomonadales bacterium]|jgi:tRNA(Ile)-lysidine synthase|nr:tRNA(Ile)-lysidine synthase [Sphingomonadales bacterium]